MAFEVKDFDTMVEDTLQRMVDADVGITNTSVGSVSRTIAESILAEVDASNYNIMQAYMAKTIDDATDSDLDDIASIFGVVREQPTSATGTVVFSTTEASVSNISIEYNQLISTRQSADGESVEAMVTDTDLYLPAGQLSVIAHVQMVEPGEIYLPAGALCIMNTSIIGISDVSNASPITGGSNIESDDALRIRTKNALAKLGRGTSTALKTALEDLDAVTDVVIVDLANGPGTANAVIVTETMPPDTETDALIKQTIADTKSAGIKVDIVYPTILTVNITVTTTVGDNTVIGAAILQYISSLGISDTLIVKQMEKNILDTINNPSADVTTTAPTSNITATGTQVIRSGVITVNGVIYSA